MSGDTAPLRWALIGSAALVMGFMVGYSNTPEPVTITKTVESKPKIITYTERVEVPAKGSGKIPDSCVSIIEAASQLSKAAINLSAAQGETTILLGEIAKNVYTKDAQLVAQLRQRNKNTTDANQIASAEVGKYAAKIDGDQLACDDARGK